MSYSKRFEGETEEAALQKAKAFASTLDMVQQPIVWRPSFNDGIWTVTVTYYGFD